MCDCCVKFGINPVFKNGSEELFDCRLYEVYGDSVIAIKLCKLHSIELFKKGEKRFVGQYGDLRKRARDLASNIPIDNQPDVKNIELVIG